MNIHFVCTGNIYRSRLAEAYLRSKEIPNLRLSSSGIAADEVGFQQVSWYTERLLKEAGILKYESPHCIEVTAEILAKQDLIVFMEQVHLDYVREHLGYTGTNYEVWHVPDVTCGTEEQPKIVDASELLCRDMTEITFKDIRAKVDDLVKRLQQGKVKK